MGQKSKGTGLSCTAHTLCASTGWLNLLGQVALTASVDSSLANHISAIWVIYNGHVFSQEELLLCYAGESPCRPCCRLSVCPAGLLERHQQSGSPNKIPEGTAPACAHGSLTQASTRGRCWMLNEKPWIRAGKSCIAASILQRPAQADCQHGLHDWVPHGLAQHV